MLLSYSPNRWPVGEEGMALWSLAPVEAAAPSVTCQEASILYASPHSVSFPDGASNNLPHLSSQIFKPTSRPGETFMQKVESSL